MKQKFPVLFVLFLCFFLSFGQTKTGAAPFVLVLDAGHGGKDPGAPGKKIKEKEITLAVTLLAGKYIAEKHPDTKIIYTRTKDVLVDLSERARIANQSRADLFISIHTNASSHTAVRGLEVYAFGVAKAAENMEVARRENSVIYLEDNYKEKYANFDPSASESYIMFEFMQNKYVEQSLNFASIVCMELKRCADWGDRGVKQAGFLVLRESTMPRILIELDFLSNPGAEAILKSEAGQKKYARAICDAFGHYKADYDRKNNLRQSASSVSTKEPSKIKKETPNLKKEVQVQAKAASNAPTNTKTAKTKRVYKVQILALPHKLPAGSPYLKGYKADYYVENKLYKYTYGESQDRAEISRIRRSLLKDFKDAFIVIFEDDVKLKQ